MILLIQIILILNILFFAWQVYLNLHYKAIQNDNFYPNISVVIPAYNEGLCVKYTIESVLAANYPADKLEIIVVNDGSKDNTHQIIEETIKNTNVRYLNLIKNKGKRNALYRGIMMSKNDIIITLDSDSTIESDTLIKLIAPFKDNTVGAVAGNIIVANKNVLIPKLLSASFTFGFKFLRPAQSVLGSVLCTPGALSAYRKSVIIKFLKRWKNSKFLGKHSNIGEDRALTTLILKNNYKVIYQDNAICYTNVPDNYINLTKMFMRWVRGDIRESFSVFYFIKNIFRKKWEFNILGCICQLLMQLIWMITPFMLFYYLYLCCRWQLSIGLFLLTTFVMTSIWSVLPCYICYKHNGFKQAVYSYLYGLFNVFTLFWVIPYCWFTIWKSDWLTRIHKKDK